MAGLTEEAAKEVEQANYARQEMREIKEQLERTVAEKLQLEKEVERLYRAKAEEVSASSVMLTGEYAKWANSIHIQVQYIGKQIHTYVYACILFSLSLHIVTMCKFVVLA